MDQYIPELYLFSGLTLAFIGVVAILGWGFALLSLGVCFMWVGINSL